MRLFTRLCVVRIHSHVLCGAGVQCAILGGILSPLLRCASARQAQRVASKRSADEQGEGETVSAALVNHAFGWLKTVPQSTGEICPNRDMTYLVQAGTANMTLDVWRELEQEANRG